MSELEVNLLVTLLVMLAVVFGIAALCIRLLGRRTPRITGTLAALCVLLAVNAPTLRAERYSARKQRGGLEHRHRKVGDSPELRPVPRPRLQGLLR
ncbi:MAG TPA: hypothetical protein VF006_07405 [Longimicrobium sp.]